MVENSYTIPYNVYKVSSYPVFPSINV